MRRLVCELTEAEMSLVDDAFTQLKSNLEITVTEQGQASRRHTAIRDHVREHWDLEDDFLTGSYRRDTKTKKLRDVDIFVVVDTEGDQAGLRQRAPSEALDELQDVLAKKWENVTVDVLACVVPFGPEDEVMSFDVVPAFRQSEHVFEIPDIATGRWITTNPKEHHRQTTEANKACSQKWVPLIKMIKAANRETDDTITPSFLLEVMGLKLIKGPMKRYQDEFALFCTRAADNALVDWDDPAGLGPAVNRQLSSYERQQMANTFRAWRDIAEEAIDLEDDGSERAAIAEWKKLFGRRMPSL